MELVIDEGNTRAKAAIFINNGIHKISVAKQADESLYHELLDFKPSRIILSTVRKPDQQKLAFWESIAPTLELTHHTPIPIQNQYETPATLGKDRLAGVIGARFLIPSGPILVIDAGTCITYDILDETDNFLGGNISPGLMMRSKALHFYTGALPEITDFNQNDLFGRNTAKAISTGLLNGFLHEIKGTISSYEHQFPGLQVAVCGGEATYFVKQIKKKIFANQNLVLLGLHKILKFNDAK